MTLISLNKTRPTKIVLIVNSESIVPDETDNPNFDVTNPNVIKTNGDMRSTAKNQGDVNLSSLLAHTALIEFAVRAIATAIII